MPRDTKTSLLKHVPTETREKVGRINADPKAHNLPKHGIATDLEALADEYIYGKRNRGEQLAVNQFLPSPADLERQRAQEVPNEKVWATSHRALHKRSSRVVR